MPLDHAASGDGNPREIVFDRIRGLHMDGLRSGDIVERLMEEFVPESVVRRIGGESGLLYSVLVAGFQNIVTQANGEMRRKIWRGDIARSTEEPGVGSDLDEMDAPIKKSWSPDPAVGLRFVKASKFLAAYDFPMLGGGLLGDATLEDLDASIAKCDARINGGMKHKSMLLRVREKMESRRSGARVRDVIPDKTLAAMIADVPREIA